MTSEDLELPHLRLVPTEDDSAELVDDRIGQWLVRFSPASELDLAGSSAIVRPPAGSALAAGLSAAAPGLADLLRGSPGLLRSGDLVVRFAPEVAKGLADGSLRLMQSSRGAMPVAMGTAGIVGLPTVVGGTAAGGAAAAGLAGGAAGAAAGAATGATAVAALPFVLAAGAAFAATWTHQRWLERSFQTLERSLHRIEARMRDADHGHLEAADGLLTVLGERVMTGELPPVSQFQLAEAHQRAEAIYASRLRYVQGFIEELNVWQHEHEERTGERVAWTPELLSRLVKPGDPTIEELVIFFKALLVRGRTTAAMAAAVTAEGDPALGIRMIDQLQEATRTDYFGIHNRLRALARTPAELSGVQKLRQAATDRMKSLVGSGESTDPYEAVSSLAASLDEHIGSRLPDREEPVGLLLPFAV